MSACRPTYHTKLGYPDLVLWTALLLVIAAARKLTGLAIFSIPYKLADHPP
jgi:hypothetical protein